MSYVCYITRLFCIQFFFFFSNNFFYNLSKTDRHQPVRDNRGLETHSQAVKKSYATLLEIASLQRRDLSLSLSTVSDRLVAHNPIAVTSYTSRVTRRLDGSEKKKPARGLSENPSGRSVDERRTSKYTYTDRLQSRHDFSAYARRRGDSVTRTTVTPRVSFLGTRPGATRGRTTRARFPRISRARLRVNGVRVHSSVINYHIDIT